MYKVWWVLTNAYLYNGYYYHDKEHFYYAQKLQEFQTNSLEKAQNLSMLQINVPCILDHLTCLSKTNSLLSFGHNAIIWLYCTFL